ncbi:rhodanese-like domain-containing protein [Clostridium peptidivorans]|uniref:rhodanese-like domain-containing protein n=1 Tax=Clostridium peptidivorans TaxID=100174 RepID=UPI000BE428A5|nr:rhodanese-like domain-containing protein [Clostridium peptidivorans]
MDKIIVALFVAVAFFNIIRRRSILSNKSVKNLSPEEAHKLINENKDVIILDVRTKEEFSSGHMPEAKSFPMHEILSRIDELESFKDKPILVYCASGGRSPIAIKHLLKNNFTNIYHLNKGISAWKYPLE